MAEGTADEQDRIIGMTGPGAAAKAEAGGWERNTTKAETASPEKPRRSERPKAEDDNIGFSRSAKPRATEEELKGDSGFKRGIPREEGAFVRGPPRTEPKGDSNTFGRGAPK